MYYYIYEIFIDDPKSSFNGKYYYGKHETKNIDDNYYGSGKLIKRYIKCHGTQNLRKTILGYYENRDDLDDAEYNLVRQKKKELGPDCINLHDGGKGGHWVEYCDSEEYERRSELVRKGIREKTTPESRRLQAQQAGLSKRNVSDERRKEWSENYKNAYRNMSDEQKKEKYSRVASSLKEYHSNLDEGKKEEILRKNIESNKKSSKEWRDRFYSIFGRTPESFRKYGKMKDSIELFYKIVDVCSEEEMKNEVHRFVESINR